MGEQIVEYLYAILAIPIAGVIALGIISGISKILKALED